MGIQGLTSLLKKISPNSIISKSLFQYKHKTIAIDTSLFIHKFMYNHGNVINGFFHQIFLLKINKIQPVYVFDGKPPNEKNNVLKKRKKAKIDLEAKILNLETNLHKMEQIVIHKAGISTDANQQAGISTDAEQPIDITKKNELLEIQAKELEIQAKELETQKKKTKKKLKQLRRQVFHITKDDFKNIHTLFNLLNVPYYHAQGEADVLCVHLNKKNIVDACMTEDMDFLTHGCSLLLRNFNTFNTNITEYNLKQILTDLDITHKQFIDICILCGCDYTCKIKNLGPISALKLIKEHINIETIIEKCCGENQKYCLPIDFDYQKARILFDGSNVELNYILHHTKEVKLIELRNFLKQHTKMKQEQIDKKLQKIF